MFRDFVPLSNIELKTPLSLSMSLGKAKGADTCRVSWVRIPVVPEKKSQTDLNQKENLNTNNDITKKSLSASAKSKYYVPVHHSL